MRFTLLSLFFILVVFQGCKNEPKNQIVVIKTEFGDMKIKLYDETPRHRDNFIRLTKDGFYNNLLFHRVINEFMIQGGDPDSKNAKPGVQLGNGGPGYDLPAEIRFPQLFHKKGVIAAAREGDNVNPEKKSSGSQFYIVQGKTFTDEELNKVEDRVNGMMKKQVYYTLMSTHKDSLIALQKDRKFDEYTALQQKIKVEIEQKTKGLEKFTIPDSLREIYKTVGGTPHLDTNYTVFGEVIEGFNVIDSIAGVKTDPNNRPLKDIKMTVEIVK
jgi:cyclophilin family peptidyl-prolyl cis-trans isomerase